MKKREQDDDCDAANDSRYDSDDESCGAGEYSVELRIAAKDAIHRIRRIHGKYMGNDRRGVVDTSVQCPCGGAVRLHMCYFRAAYIGEPGHTCGPMPLFYASCSRSCGRVTGWRRIAPKALYDMTTGSKSAIMSNDPDLFS